MEKIFDENSIQHQFDAYCKKVLRNEAKNIRKQKARIKKNEEPLDYVSESKYPQPEYEYKSSYLLLGMEILVSDPKLSLAIDALSEMKRKIVLLYYFAGFNDKEISEILNMSTSGIWYQRTKAIEQLKMGYGLW